MKVVHRRGATAKDGATLIEVMVGCLVLVVLALAGASYIFYSADTLATNRNRSLAVAKANSVMEEVCAIPFTVLTNRSFNANNYAWRSGTNWVTTGAVNETYYIGSVGYPLRTRMSNGTSRVTIRVWAGYQAGTILGTDVVILDTVYAPVE